VRRIAANIAKLPGLLSQWTVSAGRLLQATSTSVGDLSILLGKHARNAYRANDLAIDDNWDAALVRNRSLQPLNPIPPPAMASSNTLDERGITLPCAPFLRQQESIQAGCCRADV
jgi:hypothetical protein